MAKPPPRKRAKPGPKAGAKTRARDGSLQYAALPWRRAADGALEVLLITSRGTRRWVIPKGWPMKGRKKPEAAAREAYEEAGVEGETAAEAMGAYAYDKRLDDGTLQPVNVEVFALRVTLEHLDWPERAEREKLWTTPDMAATLVEEPGLRVLLALFSPD